MTEATPPNPAERFGVFRDFSRLDANRALSLEQAQALDPRRERLLRKPAKRLRAADAGNEMPGDPAPRSTETVSGRAISALKIVEPIVG